MENEDFDKLAAENVSYDDGAVNSLILDYYKKFGRKRDLEQYFSLSTAQSDIKDPSSTFWRRMKSENDSSDSGGKKSESSTELCRISIRCSLPDPSSSQEENIKTKSDTESPPIVTEDIEQDTSKQSDNESVKSDDYHSQKSVDVTLDTSMNKPFSPTSSLNSQRKLEWDSLADVGYANESERKTSGSSLSTLERYAIKQQYSNNDTKNELGAPKAHSTFLESSDSKSKPKKGLGKKTTKIYKRDVDIVELNMPRISENQPQAINVNLTKHISFNVEKDGGVTVDNDQQDVKVSPEKVAVDTQAKSNIKNDKEVQTSLLKVTNKSSSVDFSKNIEQNEQIKQGIPVVINLNSLKQRRKTKYNVVRRRTKSKKRVKNTKRSESAKEKTGGQVSEAESFEYMPGHIYNQNQMKDATNPNTVDNKSSLESSGLLTTDSSKGSKLSFTKDLEKSIVLLRTALEKHHNDSDLKKKLIKEVVQRLLKSKYRDESSAEFLSGLSFRGKNIGLGETHYTTTSTSDANNTGEKVKSTRPKKSILRSDKFNANALASTSQSAPNLPFVSDSDKLISTNLRKHVDPSNTESDVSSKEKTSSDTAFAKTSSEELYQKYLEALKREELYKKHLKDKQLFLKQKLVSSENAIQEPLKAEIKANKKLQDLMKDLTRNNYDDGSGDASKLEGGLASNFNSSNNVSIKKQRSHSVFTLSSGNSEGHNKKSILRNQILKEIKGEPASKDVQQCICPFHSNNTKVCVVDSSCQVNIECQCKKRKGSMQESPKQVACVLPGNIGKHLQYVCLCSDQVPEEVPENFLMYKCSRLINSAVQFDPSQINSCNNLQCVSTNTSPKNMVCETQPSTSNNAQFSQPSDYKSIPVSRKNSHCSQTDMNLNLNLQQAYGPCIESTSKGKQSAESTPRKKAERPNHNVRDVVEESTRWMQTEISINPKILDPVLSDVAFINDDCCAKLINQGRREVSKSCSNTCFNANEDDECCQPTLQTDECLMYSDEIGDRKTQINEDHLNDVDITASCNVQDVNTDNFTIPIQGTNMTLMVSIGANTITAPNKEAYTGTCNKGIVTENIYSVETATCLTEDCTKAVQCQHNDIFEQININQYPCDTDVGDQEATKVYSAKTCLVGDDNVKSSTYPKCVQIHDRKPLLRSNTDTHNLRNYNMQTEINVKNLGINKIAKVQCDVGCGTDETRCSDSDRIRESIKTKKRDIGTQGNLSETGVCSNICSQTKNKSRPSSPIPQQNKNYRGKKSDYDTISQKSRSQKTSPERSCSDKSRINDKTSKCGPSPQSKPKYITDPSNAFPSTSEKSRKNYSDSGTISSGQSSCVREMASQSSSSKDLVMDLIKNITERYSKKDVERLQKKKCFKEIFTVLNYLLDTEDSTDSEKKENSCACNTKVSKKVRNKYSSPSRLGPKGDEVTGCDCKQTQSSSCAQSQSQGEGLSCDIGIRKSRIASKSNVRKTIQDPVSTRNKSPNRSTSRKKDKNVQCCSKNMKHFSSNTESSDVAILTEPSSIATDAGASKVLSKIKKQCEKYHQKRCNIHTGSKFDKSSTTSICGCQCNHCHCKGHKCKSHRHRTSEKPKNKGLAYNLIIQTSDSLMCDDSVEKKCSQLKNIVLKVPPKCRPSSRVPFQEMSAKIERDMPCFREETRQFRPKSAPNDSEFSTTEDVKKCPTGFTVREYLEQNRPDFVENCNQRQNSLKLISDCRANERAVKRELLSVQLQHSPLKAISENDLRQFARQIGVDLRRRREPEKLISEREMKKHSEKIYKSLPEVVRKKEEARKENIKKTNLLMASLFKKNLQKKTLRGTVNLSNYSPVVKI